MGLNKRLSYKRLDGIRLLDILGASIGLLVLAPAFIVIAVLIKLDSRGPVFFRQKRLGLYGEPFTMYKFRSMIENAENMGTGIFNFENDFRVTKIGMFLRKFSLDELPQLINVFKGDMSLVGPRPVITYELGNYEDFSERLKGKFIVKPGLTGYAQISGRNELSADEKLVHDLKYIDDLEEFGMLINIKVIVVTIYRMFKLEGVYENPEKAKKDMERVKRAQK